LRKEIDMANLDIAGMESTQRPKRDWMGGMKWRKKILPWLFVLPILLIHGIVVIGPSFSALYYSLTSWNGIGKATFIGLENFRRLIFVDPNFKKAFMNNLIWLAFSLTVPMAIGLLSASLLAPIKKGGMFIRTVLFTPYILPAVVVCAVWRNLLSPTLGLGAELAKIGINGLDIAYLGNTKTSLLSAAFVNNWAWWGFLMVLFLNAIQSVPKDMYDAARVDGANRWQEFIHVTLPGIRPTVVFMLLMTSIWSILVFGWVYILTKGGPAGSSNVLGVMVFAEAFQKYDAGYAAAIGLTMSLFAGIFVVLYNVLRKRGWDI
jgi:raffinose/stachyose/melibiose transport system permease protein